MVEVIFYSGNFISVQRRRRTNCSHLIVVMCICVLYWLIIEKPLCRTLLFPIIMHLGL